MLKKLVFVTLYCILSPGLVTGQSMDKLERKALKVFYEERLDEALILYNDILNADPKNRQAKYRQLICHILVTDRRTPVEELLKYRSTQGRKDKFYNYWLGRVYYQQNNFKKAIESWNKFLNLKNYKSKEIIEETEYFVESAKVAEEYYSHPENYEIDQLPELINTPATEFSPVFFREKNELLYLSGKNSEIEEEEFKVYHSIRNNGQWGRPTSLEQFGRFLAKNANIEVVNNLSKLYLYKEFKKGSLYYSVKKGNKWSSPQLFDKEISSGKLESHFFINEQETRILFAHRPKRKKPDLDIYEVVLDQEKGKWSKPHVFSKNISSDFDEDYPYLTPDGSTIYFSSKGFGSIGGYDIFKSSFDDASGSWSEPVNLRYPTNSIDDDIQFKMDGMTNSGYFVSDRIDTYGGFDIFFFHESAKVLLTGMVLDKNGNPAIDTEMHFYPTRSTGLELKTMTDELGMYKVKVGKDDELKVHVLYNDSSVLDEVVKTPIYEGKEVKMTRNFQVKVEKKELIEPEVEDDPVYADLDMIGSKFRLNNKAKLSNIYFEFGEYELDPEDKSHLKPLLDAMQEKPKLRIEVSGHTDNIGRPETNLRLSLLRAKSVAQFLVDHNISPDRVEARGYGQTRPMATNDQEKEGRELNRRIEIMVLE